MPTVFWAKYVGECQPCSGPILPGQPVAYQDEQLVHSHHHDDAEVRAEGSRRGDRPPPSPGRRRRR